MDLVLDPGILPSAEAVEVTPTAAEFVLALDPGLIWFRGHFPGRPILPGVAQVHLARLFAERIWTMGPLPSHLARLKFRLLIRPGDPVHLHLERETVRVALRFRFEVGDRSASEGVIGYF